MNIYVSHSRSFDFQKDLYTQIKESSLAKEHHFIFPHEAGSETFNTRELFQSKECDLVIAEVSYPSTGQGIELAWAESLEIPIVCIYKEGGEFSKSLNTISHKFLMYTDNKNMVEDITGVLKQYE